MADWRSATAEMRFLGIDDYLAALNVLVDHLGGLVDLIGLCQGGWLSLVYAGRFPAKVRKLAMAGAPIDIEAAQSELSARAAATPLTVFEGLVEVRRWPPDRPQGRAALGNRDDRGGDYSGKPADA